MPRNVDCVKLMEQIAEQTRREVALVCDSPRWADAPDRWIAHSGATVFGKGVTAGEALEDLLRELRGCGWIDRDLG